MIPDMYIRPLLIFSRSMQRESQQVVTDDISMYYVVCCESSLHPVVEQSLAWFRQPVQTAEVHCEEKEDGN